MKRQFLLLDARIYLRDWGLPSAVVVGLIALGIAGYLYLTGHFETELADRSIHHAYSTIERVGIYRPGPKQGFAATEKFVFRVQGQEVESPAPFHADPGDPVKVDYMIGASGKIYVWKVDRGEPYAKCSLSTRSRFHFLGFTSVRRTSATVAGRLPALIRVRPTLLVEVGHKRSVAVYI